MSKKDKYPQHIRCGFQDALYTSKLPLYAKSLSSNSITEELVFPRTKKLIQLPEIYVEQIYNNYMVNKIIYSLAYKFLVLNYILQKDSQELASLTEAATFPYFLCFPGLCNMLSNLVRKCKSNQSKSHEPKEMSKAQENNIVFKKQLNSETPNCQSRVNGIVINPTIFLSQPN